VKWNSIFLCLVSLLLGCTSKKEEKGACGPLTKIKEYQVFPVFLPNNASDKEVLVGHLVALLEKLGTVHISTGCISEGPASCAGFMIAVDELVETKTGSINVVAEGEIVANKYKTSCEAWTTRFYDPTLPYPVDGENGIAFTKDLTAESPDLKTVITQMVGQFAEQYRHDNPESKPTFYVYTQLFSANSDPLLGCLEKDP
jgi:hypothetical protein